MAEEMTDTIYKMMITYQDTRIADEQAKKERVEKELATTGKTKATYDENVFNATFIWSLDVLCTDLKTRNREFIKSALNSLVDDGLIMRWNIDGNPMNCFHLKPVSNSRLENVF